MLMACLRMRVYVPKDGEEVGGVVGEEPSGTPQMQSNISSY
jgi:hypothetical protein